jgi:hypothetical protein
MSLIRRSLQVTLRLPGPRGSSHLLNPLQALGNSSRLAYTQALETRCMCPGTRVAQPVQVILAKGFDMKLRRKLAISAVSAVWSIGLIEVNAADADTESPNPPRSQQKMMNERYAACRDLHGAALKDCMANYVGTPDKNLQQNQEAEAHDGTSRSSTAAPRSEKDNHRQKGTADK